MAAGKKCQMSSPVVYSLSQAGVIQKEDESFPLQIVWTHCSLPIPTVIGLYHYNRSLMLWLLDEFIETEQGRWSPTNGFPCKATLH